MKATLHRSSKTGGTTVGSKAAHYQVDLLNGGTLTHTLATDDHPHAVVPHLPRK